MNDWKTKIFLIFYPNVEFSIFWIDEFWSWWQNIWSHKGGWILRKIFAGKDMEHYEQILASLDSDTSLHLEDTWCGEYGEHLHHFIH